MAIIRSTFGRSLFTISAVLMILCLSIPSTTAVKCSTYVRCDDCLKADPTCAWCNDKDVLLALARNASNTKPAQLCGIEQELMALGCRNIIDPPSTAQTSSSNSPPIVSISSATVKLRPGKPAMFNIDVSPPKSAAVDMYLLMDLSYTMRPTLDMLRTLASDLVTTMHNITSDFRIGFGSFVDKTVSPYSDTYLLHFPCARDLMETTATCGPSYDFRHSLTLTSNVSELQQTLDSAIISASVDEPEAILDALLQVAVCETEIGWRPRGQSQRIVVAFTDGDYHYALDSKIGGIATLPNAECRINPATKEYETSSFVEYPSVAFISDVLNENLVTPIFAALSSKRRLYENLAGSIRSAAVGTLSADGSRVISVIVDEFRAISGTVIPTIIIPDTLKNSLNVSLLPVNDCGSGSLRQNTSDICINVNFPNSVSYQVEVQGSTELCTYSGPIEIEIQFIRFGTVNVTINPQCGCDCTANPVENSPTCSGVGTLECSTCLCNQAVGSLCQCPAGSSQSDTGCINPVGDEGQICSGRGICNCGDCQCNSIPGDSSQFYQGSYCQFDPYNCPQGRSSSGQLRPCAGNGECNNIECQCSSGYTGRACDCTTDNSTCINPSGRDVALCSDAGQCVCGQCICNDYSLNFGEFCEECLPCRTSCSKVSPCVLCNILDGTGCPPEFNCTGRIKVNSTDSMASTRGMKVCSIRNGSCEVRYFLDSRIQGNEGDIMVFLDHAQSSLITLGEGSTNCHPGTAIWPIFVGIILGTILVGVIVLVLWRCCTYLGEYLEYQQWEKSIENDTERTGVNPLFVDPTSEYSNPRYIHHRT